MSVIVKQLDLQEIVDNKEKILKFFDHNINKHPPCVDDSDIWLERCCQGIFHLWGFIDSDLIGVFLTAVDGNVLNLFGLTGKNIFPHIKYATDSLIDFAKLNHIRYIQTLSSPALARKIYRDFDQRELVMITLDTWEKIY